VVACIEEHLSHSDLSEQFKYWAAKKHGDDPFPDDEGTWLRCAMNALMSQGVCDESLWQYNPNPIPGNETQEMPGDPSWQAINDAARRTIKPSCYLDTSRLKNGKASTLTQELKKGPVAIAIPVFVDRVTNTDNWNWTKALDYGHVLDPPQFSVVDGGHAICVCEYHPSTAAPGGGWFVFKNSWGTQQWSDGSNLPPPGHPAWKAGYGYISAAYVDEYLWEILCL
jgi:C1A family cysteine protease